MAERYYQVTVETPMYKTHTVRASSAKEAKARAVSMDANDFIVDTVEESVGYERVRETPTRTTPERLAWLGLDTPEGSAE